MSRAALAAIAGLALLTAASDVQAQTFADGSRLPGGPSAFGLIPSPQLSFTTRTVFHAYQVRLQPIVDESQLRDSNRFYQTVDIGGWSLSDGNVDVVASVRFDAELGNGFRRDQAELTPVGTVDDANDVDLMYLYVDWRNAVPRLIDLRVGRQLLIDDLAWYTLDGIKATGHLYRNGEDYVDLSLYAGVPVRFDVLFNSEPTLADGTEIYDGGGFPHGLTLGGSAEGQFFRRLSLSMAYRQELVFRDSEIDVFPGDVGEARSVGSTGLQESRLGASIGYSLRELALDVFGRLNWDLILDQLEQARAGISFNPYRDVHAQVEYLRVRPRFAADSIFNFFNILPYDRVRSELDLRIWRGLSVYGGYMYQVFDGDEAAFSDATHGPMGGVRYRDRRWGVGFYGEAATNTSGDIAYGGNYRIFWIDGDIAFFDQRLVLDSRVSITQHQNDWFEGADDGLVADADTSVFLNVGARGRITSWLFSRVTFVRNFGSYLAGDYRVFAELAVRYQ